MEDDEFLVDIVEFVGKLISANGSLPCIGVGKDHFHVDIEAIYVFVITEIILVVTVLRFGSCHIQDVRFPFPATFFTSVVFYIQGIQGIVFFIR